MVASVERAEQARFWPAAALPEKVDVSKNNFAIFIGENQDSLNNFLRFTRLLREEEDGWKNSPILDELVDKMMETLSVVSMSPGVPEGVSAKMLHKARNIYRRDAGNAIFSWSEAQFLHYSQVFGRQNEQMRSKLGREKIIERERILATIGEIRSDYREARRPFAEEIQAEKTKLLPQFWDYLRRDYGNFFDFVEFLKDKENPERNKIKLFMESIASAESAPRDDKKRSMFEQIIHDWKERILENPPSQIIVDFSKTLRNLPVIEEWLNFTLLIRGDASKDINTLLENISLSEWPAQLRDEFSKFVSGKYASLLGTLRLALSEFHAKTPKSIGNILSQAPASAKRDHFGQNGNGTPHIPDSVSVAERVQRQYEIGIIQKVEDTRGHIISKQSPEDISSYLRKMAYKFASGDPRIAQDFEKMLKSIQKDPYGFGVKKLHGMTITIDRESRINLRSLNPRNRMGLILEHPDSMEIRFVFAIKDDIIAIEGIYSHDEYDRRFR